MFPTANLAETIGLFAFVANRHNNLGRSPRLSIYHFDLLALLPEMRGIAESVNRYTFVPSGSVAIDLLVSL
jgi:hypothetical protein